MANGLQLGSDGKLRLKAGKLVIDDGTHPCCCSSSPTYPPCSCFCSELTHKPNAYTVAVSGVSFTAPAGMGIVCGDPLAINFTYTAPSWGTAGYAPGDSPIANSPGPGCCCGSLTWRRLNMLTTCQVGNTYVNGNYAGGSTFNWAMDDLFGILDDGGIQAGGARVTQGTTIFSVNITGGSSDCSSSRTIAFSETTGSSSQPWFGGSVTFSPLALGSMGDCSGGTQPNYNGPCTGFLFTGTCVDYAP